MDEPLRRPGGIPGAIEPPLYHGNFGLHPAPPRRAGKSRAKPLTLTSPAFPNGGRIPRRHAAEGENLSPPLAWSNVRQETKSLVLMLDDSDGPERHHRVHWIVYNLPPSLLGLPEAVRFSENPLEFSGVIEGKNDFGRVGYDGPDPRDRETHPYRFTIYALDAVLDLPREATRAALFKAMKGHLLSAGELRGSYLRGR